MSASLHRTCFPDLCMKIDIDMPGHVCRMARAVATALFPTETSGEDATQQSDAYLDTETFAR